MESIFRISSSMSAAWVSWAMFVLFALLALSGFFLADIATVFRNLFSRSDRLYVDSTWQKKLVSGVYLAGVVAMIIYLLVSKQTNNFALLDYLKVVGIVGGVLVVQYWVERFVGAVFLSMRQMDYVFESRTCVSNAVSAILWPCALFAQWVDNVILIKVVCYVVLGIFVGVLFLKSVQFFFKNPLSIFYILLYIVSLEIVPLVVAISVVKHTLQ